MWVRNVFVIWMYEIKKAIFVNDSLNIIKIAFFPLPTTLEKCHFERSEKSLSLLFLPLQFQKRYHLFISHTHQTIL